MSDFPPGYTSPPPPGAGGPQQLPPLATGAGWTLASWWSRVGAQLIDAMVILAVSLVPLLGFGILGAIGIDGDGGPGGLTIVLAFLVTALVMVLVALIYAPLMMSATNGRTLGRMATGIRVVRVDGRPMTFGHAAFREVLVKGGIWVLSTVTIGLLWIVDVLWPLWDEENRALHDFLTRTRTVKG